MANLSSLGHFFFCYTVLSLAFHLHIDGLAAEREDEHQLTSGVMTPREVPSTAVNHQVINPLEECAPRRELVGVRRVWSIEAVSVLERSVWKTHSAF